MRPATRDLARTVWTAVPPGPLVLVPIGSTEQHGPHLPLDTDSVIARAVAERAADALSAVPEGPPLVAPTMVYGASGEHAGFPGTVSIGHEALCSVIVESVRSLSLWAGRVVFVNGHGGNTVTLDTAVARLRAEGHDVAWTGCGVPGGDAHAGRTETSVMLHLAPRDVRMDAAVAGDTRPVSALMPDLVAHGVRAVSPTGVLGDPTGASAEEGRRAMELMVSLAVGRIAAGVADSRGRLVDPVDEGGDQPEGKGVR
ncbi:mycofactocin biosynthesis peptidyl-dipeptidase MftE [Streptomyces blattellae]|uniref:mycofactocin biosynthesis peptidyl-dipeptidase MftE n=1 Tax=Streptomyces blattellae TaxID=2569855 RepID=UPI0012B863F6|nr:mycofactocin biosynthesis peptidyl-dipeptidase MftE [Streptomyces blattellae]